MRYGDGRSCPLRSVRSGAGFGNTACSQFHFKYLSVLPFAFAMQADDDDDGLLTFSRPMVAADGSVLLHSPSMSGSGSLPGGLAHATAEGATPRCVACAAMIGMLCRRAAGTSLEPPALPRWTFFSEVLQLTQCPSLLCIS